MGLKHSIDAQRNAAVIGGWVAAAQFAKAMAGEGLDPLAEVLEWFAPRPPARPQTAAEMRGAWQCWVVASGGTLAADPAENHPDPKEASQ